MFILLAGLSWVVWSTVTPQLERHPGILFAILLIGAVTLLCAIVMLLMIALTQIPVVLMARGDGVLCEHTLTLTDEGLVEETEVNRSLHRYVAIEPVSRAFGFWIIGINGVGAFVFRRGRLLEGNPEEFAAELRRRLKA